MSRWVLRSWLVFCNCCVACCMRSEKCAFCSSCSSFVSALMSLARSSLAFIAVSLLAQLTHDERRLQRQLGSREGKRLARQNFIDAVQFIDDIAGPHFRDPVLRVALAVAHADLGRLLRDRLVGKDPDPDATATLDVAADRAPRGLDLACSQPAAFSHLQAVLAEGDMRAAQRQAAIAAFLLLAVLASSRLQH